MIKKILNRIKYSGPIWDIMVLMRKISSNYFENQWDPDYKGRGIINLYPYQNYRPWNITLFGTVGSIKSQEDHEHLNACFRIFAKDKNEIKKIISELVIEAQDMSAFEGFPVEYESIEELNKDFERYKQNIEVVIVP